MSNVKQSLVVQTGVAQAFIEQATSYFKNVDGFDTDGIMSHLTDDVILEVPTHGVRKEGRDEVRQAYLNRTNTVKESWHGNFQFTCDEANARLVIRLDVKRTNVDGSQEEMDNLTLLAFKDNRICHITVWMSGENSLT